MFVDSAVIEILGVLLVTLIIHFGDCVASNKVSISFISPVWVVKPSAVVAGITFFVVIVVRMTVLLKVEVASGLIVRVTSAHAHVQVTLFNWGDVVAFARLASLCLFRHAVESPPGVPEKTAANIV